MTDEREALAHALIKCGLGGFTSEFRSVLARRLLASDWLRNHDRHTRATTLRDAAEAWATGEWAEAFTVCGVMDDESAARTAAEWLLQRADREGTP